MIAWIMAQLAARGVSKARQGPLAWLIAAIAAVLLAMALWGAFSLWLGQHDKAVVAADRAEANAEFTADQLDAERSAGAAKRERDKAADEDQDELEGMIDEAESNGASAADDAWSRLWRNP